MIFEQLEQYALENGLIEYVDKRVHVFREFPNFSYKESIREMSMDDLPLKQFITGWWKRNKHECEPNINLYDNGKYIKHLIQIYKNNSTYWIMERI